MIVSLSPNCRFNTDGCENTFTQLKFLAGKSNFKRMGTLDFERVLRDFLLGAGNHIPISKSSAVQESEVFEPFLSPVLTDELVEPTPTIAEEDIVVPLDQALDDIMDELASDQAELRNLNFTLPEEEGFKYLAGSQELQSEQNSTKKIIVHKTLTKYFYILYLQVKS